MYSLALLANHLDRITEHGIGNLYIFSLFIAPKKFKNNMLNPHLKLNHFLTK